MSAEPVVIATLTARSARDSREEIDLVARSGADLAEVRIDRWPEVELPKLWELFPSPIPLIGTYRSRAEGGEGSDDPKERRSRFAQLASLPFEAVDRESERDPDPEPTSRVRTIWSTHRPDARSAEWVRLRFAEPTKVGWFRKVVVRASLSEALDRLDPGVLPGPSSRYVFHTTGPSGSLVRAAAAELGMSAVYGAPPVTVDRPAVEPSQVPVDRLIRFIRGTRRRGIYGLVGRSVGMSASPALFAGWFEALDETALYVPIDIGDPEEFRGSVPRLHRIGVRGLNVTRPWKRLALEIANEAGPYARTAGCANTLELFDDGSIRAENTDVIAIVRRLSELGWNNAAGTPRSVLVVGTGGAARAALAALRAPSIRRYILGRDKPAAQRLAAEFGAAPASDDPVPCELVINATPIGRGGGPPAVDIGPWLARGGRLLDFVYRPEAPFLSGVASERGATYETGARLLAYQAAESHAIWFGRPVPAPLVEAAAESLS